MKKIYIMDDDVEFLEKEESLIRLYLKECIITKTFSYDCDAYFLDIEAPTDGLSLARQIREKNEHTIIIFVTNHDELIFEAQKAFPFYFVRKQCMEEMQVVLLELSKKWKTHTIEVYTNKGHQKVSLDVSQIIAVYKDDNYCSFITNQASYRLRESLEAVSKKLTRQSFVFIDKGMLVNIEQMEKFEGDRLIDRQGRSYEVSRRKKKEINKLMLTKGC
ncbi:LytR/AlgR family response regulator transcription factor [Intestinibaculum porci]|uniref:LytR/AlgR family response regulator transcription factor n=1 Tax=Intestinibaculum porci TaxID=2487118 RepID=UPI0024096C38|nr:LytTR family transcriptional regulator DNA-binding domain-containing protein [Intestinibaculum porci]MDD6350602.1 LytTR family transcriptional regulator DNA-binding domain-containing protein [Intestinibaculum porci]MDD6422678.1 LytTR family transcriptional regulator DNA-binding domain-containing protein [Intestinibaculum porci]